MLRKLALISAVSAFAIGTALAQSPNPPASSDSPSMSQQDKSPSMSQDKSPSMSQDKPSTTTTQSTSSMPSSGAKAEFIAAQKPDQFLASKFKGTDVLGSDNQKIGDVSDILFDKNGKIDAYVVSVGGFLGIGSKEVALAPTAFQVVPPDPNSVTDRSAKLKTSMTKDQLKEAANFEPYKEPRATTGTGGAGAPRPSGSSGGMSK
jgi:sporulation protein YlmC with PRC-barrel domain